MLCRSGYVELWTRAEERQHLESAFLRYWEQVGPHRSVVQVSSRAGAPVGTVAATALGPHTWMMHHLGVEPGTRADRAALRAHVRALLTTTVDTLSTQPHLRTVALHVQAGKRFNEHLYGDFARALGEPSQVCWFRNQVFRAQTHAMVWSPDAAHVRTASDAQRQQLARVYARTRPALERAARALDVPGLAAAHDCAPVDDEPPGCTRQVYAFAPGGRATWALVCDAGSEGANLFGLLNTCWLTQLAPCDAHERARARRALLRHALGHYHALGKAGCLLFEPLHAPAEDALESGFRRVSEGQVWLCHRDALPAWREHLEHALGGASTCRERGA